MIRKRGLTVLMVAALFATAAACGGGGTSGGTSSTCNPNAVSAVPASGGSAIAAAATARLMAFKPSDPVLKIGFIGMLAGKYQNYGIDAKNGAQLAVDQMNAAGGVQNQGTTYTFQLDPVDDNADATQGAQSAQKLVDDGVVAVIGGIFSTATIAESKIFNDNGITQISPSATNPKYTAQGFKTAFRVIGNDVAQGHTDAEFAVKTLGCKNVAILDDKSTYGQGLADSVNDAIPGAGGKIVAREHLDATASDFTAQLTTIKGKHPDVIFYGGYSAQAGPLTSQARKLGIKVPFVMGDGCEDSDYTKLAGTDAEGAFASNGGPAQNLMTGFAEFNTKFKAKYSVDVFQYAPQAFDAANIIMNAVKTAGATKAAILSAVAATKDYKGLVQSYTFDSKGDITTSIFTVYKVESGNFKAVKAVTIGG
ncbi:MAG: branched-chain amino acid ABC transporter substrate-binding protein [Chloroflexi bacterium]|nr:MAG: branched-chain amino acid ABC transporter substrate-binding protein [Chloroflexota bacterium]